jgi:diguanylate cyclase (GGDEF)-like protein
MLDVDCFKQYNDQYGHLAGDDCLKAVARTLQSSMHRPGDFIARYGGEEFAVILPNTDAAGAAAVLTKVLGRVRKLAISHTTSKVSRGVVTASIGYATVIPCGRDSPSDFLHRADQALYEAKFRGRDQLGFSEQKRSTRFYSAAN